MIILRHLTRELLTSVWLFTGALLAILLSHQFVKYCNQMAGGQLFSRGLWILIVLEVPRLLVILLPVSLFLAILFTYSQLHTHREMIALHSCGLSQTQLTLFSLPVISFVTLSVACLSLWANPKLLYYRNAFLARPGSAIELQAIQPGRFQHAFGGQCLIYVEGVLPNHKQLKNFFMIEQKGTGGQQGWTLFTAQRAYQARHPGTKESFLVLVNGRRYQRVSGTKEYYIAHFSRYALSLNLTTPKIIDHKEVLSTSALLHTNPSNKQIYAAEWQWRVSAPLSTVLLALLAIPLSQVNPRQDKYQPILLAILIYIIYLNLLLTGKHWIESTDISHTIGLWWIHGLLSLVTSIVWLYKLGWHTLKGMIVRQCRS